ncbi:MAG TPA: hypothetical protein VN708_26500 [Terriglobales bacterium]|nr:hypothetical protein [Terriglobales bacterium]
MIICTALVLPRVCEGAEAEIRAFSLREANRRAANGTGTPELKKLGGITRFCGMVFDRQTRDVILVGRTRSDFPEADLDDLAVALRSRLSGAQYPRVSIDMVEDTPKTGKQEVRFDGGIERTKFGADFLESDVILKRYSLDLLQQVQGISPYLKLYEGATRTRLADQGHDVREVRWLSEKEGKEAVQKHSGKNATESATVQSRFWFHVRTNDSFIVEKDDVYVIEELRLGVQAETMLNQGINASGKKVEQGKDELADEFARQFSANYQNACGDYPLLKRLKVLFDLVCIAEGIAHLGTDRPNLDTLLTMHQMKAENTPKTYPLLQRVGEFRSKGDATVLVQLSGGIDLEAILLALEDGDVNALKLAVTNSRPSRDALSWDLPLDEWKMPNDEAGITARKQSPATKIKPKELGFGLAVQEFLFDPARPGDTVFRDFPPLPGMKHAKVQNPQFKKLDRMGAQHEVADKVGGVLLNDVARVEGAIGSGATLGKGNFAIVVNGDDCGIDETAYRQFVTSLWAVYFGREDPGISIDPIAHGAIKQLVRYIGNVKNLDLGRVMREADYLMKQWAVGTEQPSIATFKTPDDYANELRTLYLGSMSRFWFVPENMKFKVTPDALFFQSGNMTVKTEFLMSNAEGRGADPANERFAKWLTENYHGQVIKRYPIYHELYDYAKLVALAKYLKESGVPLYWFLMANKELVLTEDAPGSVPSLFKDSKHFQDVKIEGGVNLVQKDVKAKGYIFDEATKEAIRVASMKSAADRDAASRTPERPKYVAKPVTLELGTNQYYTALPQHSSSSGKDRRGIRYQTDISLRTEGYEITPKVLAALQPAIRQRHVWNDLRDKIDGLMKGKSEAEFEAAFENALQAAQAKTGAALRKLALLQGKFYPTEPEFAKDAAFALEDKDQFELLGDLLVSYAKYYTSLDLVRVFDPNRANQPGDFGDGWRLLIPYRLRPASKTAAKGYQLPSKMEIVNLITDRREVLDFATDTNQNIGYFPATNSPSEFIALFVLTDASFRLVDRIGCEFQFNHNLNLTEMLFTEDHSISVEYLEKTGTAFETSPYRIVPENPEARVTFRNVTLPKRMKVTDGFGADQVLEFTEKNSPVGWYPPTAKTNRFKTLALMSDASYVLADGKGNEFSFDGGGHFTEMVIGQDEPIVRSLKMGKNRITFRYRLDPAGNILIAKAWVGQDEIGAKPLYVINYDYDLTGRLANRQLLFASGKPIFGQ